MVVFDTTFLTLMFVPNAKHPLPDANERIVHLIAELSARGDQIVVGTPALSELLITTGNARGKILAELTNNPRWIIADFDLRAALELSLFTDAAITTRDKRQGIQGTWAKLKFDRQIVAIAKVWRASRIYSDDQGVHSIGRREGIPVSRVADISLPGAGGDFRLTP